MPTVIPPTELELCGVGDTPNKSELREALRKLLNAYKNLFGESGTPEGALESLGIPEINASFLDAVTAAQVAAEAARDAALIQAGVYETEVAGRAAVADGEAFKVQGSGDIAAYEYRRVNAGTVSTLIATYPSKAAYDSLRESQANFSIGKNLFNPLDADVIIGSYISAATGAPVVTAGFRTTGYMRVNAGSSYSISAGRQMAWYDQNKVYLSGVTPANALPITVVAPALAVYLRTAVTDSNLALFQVELGVINTAWAAYERTLSTPLTDASVTVNKIASSAVTTAKIADAAITGEKIADQAISESKTTFFHPKKNLFNKAVATVGFYTPNTGGIFANATYEVSDLIPVVEGATYAISPAGMMRFSCYFDALGAVVAGGNGSGALSTFTIPATVAYVKVTTYVSAHNTFQLERGSSATAYEDFSLVLLDSVIPPIANGAPEMVMPPFIFGVQGRECNVYLDNLHLADATEYLHDITSAGGVGVQQQERWTWTPSGALTSGSLVVNAHDKRTGSMLVSKTANQRAAASTAGTGLTKKVIVIGDSLVGAGTITQTLLDISAGDVMTATMHGTQGIAPNQHEGRGGWAISTYVTTGSPFYISGAVNFPQYLTNNSIATPDWVLIHLGINDVFGQTSDAAANSTANAAFVNLDILIASIKAAGAGVNVGLMIPTPGSKFEDAFGNNYATGQTGWRFKRNILIWARQLIATYAGQEANRIYLIPSNTALDTVNNMSVAASAPVNSRSLVSSTRQSNGVHPATQGYQQIADAVWAFLKFYA